MTVVTKSIEIAESMFPSEYDRREGYQAFHFCFIWKRNKLISTGTNNPNRENGRVVLFAQKFNVPDMIKWPYMHAEIDAISKLWGRYHINSSLKTVVLRINNRMQLKPSMPCNRCMPVLSGLGLDKRLWYSDNKKVVKHS